MTDRMPTSDQRAQDHETVHMTGNVSRPVAASAGAGAIALPEEPTGWRRPHAQLRERRRGSRLAASGVRPHPLLPTHRLAVASLVVLILVALVAIFAKQIAPYGYDEETDLNNIAAEPTLEDHWFGTDLLGRDYLSRVIFGVGPRSGSRFSSRCSRP